MAIKIAVLVPYLADLYWRSNTCVDCGAKPQVMVRNFSPHRHVGGRCRKAAVFGCGLCGGSWSVVGGDTDTLEDIAATAEGHWEFRREMGQ